MGSSVERLEKNCRHCGGFDGVGRFPLSHTSYVAIVCSELGTLVSADGESAIECPSYFYQIKGVQNE